MIVDCISDLHGHFPKLEGGDLLIVAGDLTAQDTHQQMMDFFIWLTIQKYRTVVFIAGNHDNSLVGNTSIHRRPNEDIGRPNIAYLLDNGIEFEGLKIWGSPWTRTFKGMNPHCKAFTYDTEEELAEKWAMIPTDVDILITHSPPFTIQDITKRGEQVGSTSLMAEFMTRLRPKLWVFGHIHEAYGQDKMRWADTILVNASHVNEFYEPVNKPVRILL